MRPLAVVVVVTSAAMMLAGCFDSQATTCADGTICPASKVCAPAGNACVDRAQVTACAGIADGETCSLTVGPGVCNAGVCELELFEGCGDGVVGDGETCDDSNMISGDGCRADCQKIEMCGDAIVDTGEVCDDANDNPADGCDACGATEWTAMAILGAGVDATATGMRGPTGVAIDAFGNVYVSDTNNQRVRRIDPAGKITTVAGNGVYAFAGDGGDATSASLSHPYGVAVDGLGNLYIADTNNHRIRKVDTRGIITTVAGGQPINSQLYGFGGDGGLATLATLNTPHDVAVDGLGNLYIADTNNHRIRKVGSNGMIVTVAGSGVAGYNGDTSPQGQTATSAQLNTPIAVAVDSMSRIYVADRDNHRVRRIDGANIDTIAGTGATSSLIVDNIPADAAALALPEGVEVDASFNVYIADTGHQRVRRVANSTGLITTLAGSGDNTEGFSGDGGPATSARLAQPRRIALDTAGNLVIPDTANHRVRRVVGMTISTISGDGTQGFVPDGAAATTRPLNFPSAAAFDAMGQLYFTDTLNQTVRRIGLDGTLVTIAGGRGFGSTGDGSPALTAFLTSPRGIAIDGTGNIYISEESGQRIRRIDPAGIITTVAGNGNAGYLGDGVSATSTPLNNPYFIAYRNNTLYIADTQNHRIRAVTGGIITTVAGNGTPAFGGDNGDATLASLDTPRGIAIDTTGNLFIADTGNHRIRMVDTNGTITTVAGDGTSGSSGDNGPASAARVGAPRSVAVDATGNLYIADSDNHRIRRMTVGGNITTVAGGSNGLLGDGGPATSAQLNIPSWVALDPNGGYVIVDHFNNRLRRVTATGQILPVAGDIDPEGMGAVAVARLADPRMFVRTPTLTLFAGGSTGTVQALRTGVLEVVAGRYAHPSATASFARFRNQYFGSVGGIAYDAAMSRFYITANNSVYQITAPDLADETTWTITALNADAGGGFNTSVSVAGTLFRDPAGLYFDPVLRQLYVADAGNHVIRMIDLQTSTIQTVAGTPQVRGFFGDGNPATTAGLFNPRAIARCANGDLFIADTGNNRVRRIATSSKTITTIVGDGVAASSGDGSPSAAFPVDTPQGLACDELGNVYVSSTTSIRLVTRGFDGVADGKASVSTVFGGATGAQLPNAAPPRCLTGVDVIDAATVRASDCAGAYLELTRARLP